MGYWIEGRVEGDYVLDVEVEFMVKGVSLHHHGAEVVSRDYEDDPYSMAGFIESGGSDFPHEWVEDGSWTDVEVKKVELVREGEKPEGWEEAANGDLDLSWDELPEYEADYRVTMEFRGVRVPFAWEKWTEKLSCIDDGAGHEAADHMRGALNHLRSDLPSTARLFNVTWANVDAKFSGVGEDGKPWPDVKIDGGIPIRSSAYWR